MKKFLLIAACLLLVTGCKEVKLENGENAIITFKDGGISSDDFYKELKSQYGEQMITNVIDSYLLNKEYETDSEEKKYINQTIKSIKSSAESSGTTFETYINLYYGLTSEDSLKNYLSLNYKRSKWVLDYAKEAVSDKQVNQYYDNFVFGDIEASQILITVDASSSATDEEKKEAESKALAKANEIIGKLKNGEDFAKLAKEYSKDETSASNGGSLGKVNDGDLAEEALTALRNLSDGSYTTSAVKSSYGYHILYRTSMDEKPELTDELKDEIKTTIGTEMSQEAGFGAKALLALRQKNEMKFIDTEIEDMYKSAN